MSNDLKDALGVLGVLALIVLILASVLWMGDVCMSGGAEPSEKSVTEKEDGCSEN